MEAKSAIEEIEGHIRRTNDRRMYERLQAIHLLLLRAPVKQIAEMLRRSDKTIRTYIRAYKDSGFEELEIKHAPGKSCRLTAEQRDELKQVMINQVPADVGFPAKFNWTLQIIAQYILTKAISLFPTVLIPHAGRWYVQIGYNRSPVLWQQILSNKKG